MSDMEKKPTSIVTEAENISVNKTSDRYEGKDKGVKRNNFSRPHNNTYNNNDNNDMQVEVLAVDRVSCTTAGGRRMSFRATVAIGDGKGIVGIGAGKATEVPDAINKAERQARKNLFRINMYGKTIMYDCEGKSGATKVILKRAKNGTGFITSNAIKSVLRLGGVENLVSKVYGSTNTNNILIALVKAIKSLETPKRIAARRGKTLAEIMPFAGIQEKKNLDNNQIKGK
jgi:small subunit ribosomal protein S5